MIEEFCNFPLENLIVYTNWLNLSVIELPSPAAPDRKGVAGSTKSENCCRISLLTPGATPCPSRRVWFFLFFLS